MDLKKLSGPQQKILREVLVQAFDSNSLDMLLSDRFDTRLYDVIPPGAFNTVVFQLIQYAQQQGLTDKLIAAAQQERPDNPNIQSLMSQLRLIDVEGNKYLVQRSLERTVKEKAGIQDFVAWTTKLEQLRKVVCRIEDPRDPRKALGTGFLVSSDLVLTNYHVVEMYIDVIDPDLKRVRDTAQLRCRFDYAIETGGENPGLVKTFRTDAGWLVDHSKYSRVDPGDQGGFPPLNELDYALLRLNEPVGDAPGPGGGIKRGWITLSTLPPVPQPTDVLFIVQHPKGQPLKLAVGAVIALNQNGTRIRYDTNTEGGSSGSPCLDAKLNLVALHHGGDPDTGRLAQFNQGIPIDRIVGQLAAKPGMQPIWT